MTVTGVKVKRPQLSQVTHALSVSSTNSMMAGIGLFGAIEKWGRTMGAGKLIMVKCHEAVKDMDGFFIRQGYRQSEVRYTKKL